MLQLKTFPSSFVIAHPSFIDILIYVFVKSFVLVNIVKFTKFNKGPLLFSARLELAPRVKV